MKSTRIYAIVDKKADMAVSIFCSVNDTTAERSFIDLITAPIKCLPGTFEDFEVVYLCDVSELSPVIIRDGNSFSKEYIHSVRLEKCKREAECIEARTKSEYVPLRNSIKSLEKESDNHIPDMKNDEIVKNENLEGITYGESK